MAKTFVGSRIRQLRGERGFSQAALAQMLEISPSYLNQIEHDVRPLTVSVLRRITEVFGVDATFFASEDDTRLIAELREVTMDRDVATDVDLAEVSDMVGSHPALARAMVNLHRRYRLTAAQLAAATEGVALDAISGYRSHAYQLGIFERKRARGLAVADILQVNAAPGYSEHHSGFALDIGTPGEPPAEESFEHTAAFAWLQGNAGRFGFQLSYPRDNPHGIVYEPWHWRWRAGSPVD